MSFWIAAVSGYVRRSLASEYDGFMTNDERDS